MESCFTVIIRVVRHPLLFLLLHLFFIRFWSLRKSLYQLDCSELLPNFLKVDIINSFFVKFMKKAKKVWAFFLSFFLFFRVFGFLFSFDLQRVFGVVQQTDAIESEIMS